MPPWRAETTPNSSALTLSSFRSAGPGTVVIRSFSSACNSPGNSWSSRLIRASGRTWIDHPPTSSGTIHRSPRPSNNFQLWMSWASAAAVTSIAPNVRPPPRLRSRSCALGVVLSSCCPTVTPGSAAWMQAATRCSSPRSPTMTGIILSRRRAPRQVSFASPSGETPGDDVAGPDAGTAGGSTQ